MRPLQLFTAYGQSAASLSARWRKALDEGQTILVGYEGETPLGLCWYARGGTFGTGAYLRLLAVAPAAQQRGVGKTLLDAYEQACGQPAGGWFLLTSDFNVGAQRFYTRHGYQEVGRLPSFAKAGIVEKIYWKPPAGN